MPLHLTEAEAEALGILDVVPAPQDKPIYTGREPAPIPTRAQPVQIDSPTANISPDEVSRVIAQRCLLNGTAYLRLTLKLAQNVEVFNGGLRWQHANGTLAAAFPLPEALVIGLDLRAGIPARTLVFKPLSLSQLKELAGGNLR